MAYRFARCRRGRGILIASAIGACLLLGSSLSAEVITLRNGMRLEGDLGKISSVGADPLSATGAGEVKLKRVIVCDDNLRRVFVGTNQVATAPVASPAIGFERINIEQRVSVAGRSVASVGSIVRVTPFDEFGRRIFTMSSPQGTIDIVQGITQITPSFTKVEALSGHNSYLWTMRIATSSIPRATLSKVLMHAIDRKNADQRLSIVRLYIQSERIQDARAELEQLIVDFPKLEHLKDQVKALHQLGAQRLLKEVQVRKDAGQHQLAYAMLANFPGDGVAGETLLKVRDMLDEYKATQVQVQNVLERMKALFPALKDDKAREEITPICNEIAAELNGDTLARMADFIRLADDQSLSADQRLSLAISGWLMGGGAGVDNLAVSKSLVVVRDLVREYLSSKRNVDRAGLLAALRKQEGSSPGNVAKLIANMKPPVETLLEQGVDRVDVGNVKQVLGPPKSALQAAPQAALPAAGKPGEPGAKLAPAAQVDPLKNGGDCAPGEEADDLANLLDGVAAKQAAPAKGRPDGGLLDAKPIAPGAVPPVAAPPAANPPAAAPNSAVPNAEAGERVPFVEGIPGLLAMQVPGLPEDPQIDYLVQLPPEYDPYRRYPVIVTLNGGATTPRQQIDWWAGAYNPAANLRYGQASRYGYIVVAPRWTREHQRKYEYSAREHAAVLYSLRDVCRRFAVDTDRVFLSGHSMGGDAAWDIALAHPDLWAGVLPVVAVADKYVTRYWENAAYVSFYFVCGEKDGNKLTLNAVDWDRYLTHTGFDTTIVQYQGRGHEHFHDEIQYMFDWMNLHRRNFFPKEFEIGSMRPWDNFFWWTELSKFPNQSMVMPVAWPPPGGAKPAITEAAVLGTNSVRVNSGAQKVTVYLAPEMVNFDDRVTVTINSRRQLNIEPDLETLLEDVRTRGDRQHPFWAKVSN